MALQRPPFRSEVVKDAEDVLKTNYFTPNWVKWLLAVFNIIEPGITVTITTAPLTGAGTPGSMTFVNGILVDQTQAT